MEGFYKINSNRYYLYVFFIEKKKKTKQNSKCLHALTGPSTSCDIGEKSCFLCSHKLLIKQSKTGLLSPAENIKHKKLRPKMTIRFIHVEFMLYFQV